MDAMLANEPSESLFTKDCMFTENGVRLPLGDEGLWASMVGKGNYKFYVPDIETQQIGYFGTARAEAQNPGDKPRPVAIALRLKIEGGLISEAEQLVIRPESNLLNPIRSLPAFGRREHRKNGRRTWQSASDIYGGSSGRPATIPGGNDQNCQLLFFRNAEK